MLKKTITYKDYDGVTHIEDFYFNLSRAEVLEMELEVKGGMSKMLNNIVKINDNREMVKIFKDIILRSYGEKSPDGKRFIKSAELATAFSQTEAYTELFLELGEDATKAAAFMNGILPPKNASEAGSQIRSLREPDNLG